MLLITRPVARAAFAALFALLLFAFPGQALAQAEKAEEPAQEEIASEAEGTEQEEAVEGEIVSDIQETGEEAGEAAAEETVASDEYFSRTADPVVIKGERVEKFKKVHGEKIGAFSDRGNGLEPIPFQVDEYNKWGEFVLTEGKMAEEDYDKGKIDDNDELVFLTRDLGKKADPSKYSAGKHGSYEIEVKDPLTGSVAYAYLISFDDKAPRSDRSYMSYDDAKETVIAENYELGWQNTKTGLDYDYLVVTKAAGGSGRDIFDRLKIRVLQTVRRWFAMGFTPRIDRTEDNFLVRYYGLKKGPVRIIRTSKISVKLIGSLPAPGATVNYLFYPDWLEAPVPINIPFKLSIAFTKAELDVSHDYDFKPGSGMMVMAADENGVFSLDAVDGVMTEGELAQNTHRFKGRNDYYGFYGPEGAGFYAVRPPEGWKPELYGLYRDDPEIGIEPAYWEKDDQKYNKGKDRPENIPGAAPLAGGRFINMEKLSKGIHTVLWYHFYPPHYDVGEEKAYLDIIDRPIQVTIR